MASRERAFDSPLGRVVARVNADDALAELFFDDDDAAEREHHETPALLEVERQLRAFFAGERMAFELPTAPTGTAFQRRVWSELVSVPAGATTTYGELAARTGSVARAVGSANGQNPIAVVVPCHRVIGQDGTLTGYAGGLSRKRWLLAHEATHARGSERLL